MTVAMALAEKLHHTSRGQKNARAGEEGHEEYDASRRPSSTAGALPVVCGRARRGAARVPDPRPQEQVQRHIVDGAHCRPRAHCSRGANSRCTCAADGGTAAGHILHFFDTLTPDPKQVIEVPKILPDDVPMRTAVRDTQLAEQLVEVPKILYFLKQKVDIPVPGGGGRFAGLQGFLPGQSSTAPTVTQIVDNSAPSGGFQGFRPGQSSSFSSHSPAAHEVLDEPGEGFLRTFPQSQKSAKLGSHLGSELSADFSSSTPVAQLASPFFQEGFWEDHAGGMSMRLPSGR